MGLLSKLMFWKKEEPLPDLGKGPDMGLPPMDDMGAMPGMPKAGGDELGLPPELGAEPRGGPGMDMPKLEEAPAEAGFPRPAPPAASAPTPPMHGEASGKDLEIISLKLDSLKTTLEAINERLARLEKMAEGGSESRHRF
jgi:hypothetical protein